MYIDVEFEGIQLLNYARESALSKGVITDEEQEVSVKAKLSIGSKVYKVKLSPTGQNLDKNVAILHSCFQALLLHWY